jgi:hypothetical protein
MRMSTCATAGKCATKLNPVCFIRVFPVLSAVSFSQGVRNPKLRSLVSRGCWSVHVVIHILYGTSKKLTSNRVNILSIAPSEKLSTVILFRKIVIHMSLT